MAENEFHRKVKVYYEDTDAGGVVYHSRYLNFMERCRSDWMDAIGYSVKRVEDEFGILFVLREVNIQFIQPAHLSDQLTVSCHILHLGKIRLVMGQNVYNQGQLICAATIKIATIDRTSYKLTPLPLPMRQQMSKYTEN